MNKTKLMISLVLAISILMVQVGGVLAAPVLPYAHFIAGKVESITVDTDPNTGVTTVIIELLGANGTRKMVRIGQQTAESDDFRLITIDADGNPVIIDSALGKWIEIDTALIIPDEEVNRQPVASALATFFSGIADYKTIMGIHEKGVGFGVIAQALWLTMEVKGDSDLFQAFVDAKQNNDYTYFSSFTLPDGSSPENWGQLRKAMLNGEKKLSPGHIIAGKDNTINKQNQDTEKTKDNNTDKNKEKNNNGNGNGNK